MEPKLSDVPLQPLMKSSEAEDEKAVAHVQAELREASQGKQEQNKGQHWLKRCLPQKGRSIFIAVTTLLGYILLYLAISAIAPFYPIWALQKGANLIIAGFVIGMAGLSVAVSSPILGVCLPQLGLKFSQVAGLFLAGGTFILFAFVTEMPNGAVFIAFSFTLRAVEGVGTSMYSTASYALMAQLFSEHKGMIVALQEVSIVTGFSIGAPIGGLLQAVGGFKLPFVTVGTIMMLLVLVLCLQQLSVSKSEKPGVVSPRVLCRLFRFPVITLLVVTMVLSSATLGALISTLGHFLHAELGLGLSVIGAVYLAISVPYVISSIVVGKLTDKVTPRYLEIAGVLLSIVAFFIVGPPKFISEPKLWICIAVLPFLGIGFSLVAVPVFSDMYITASTQSSHDEVLAGAVSGILVSTIAAGEFLGPAFGGVLVYYLGFQWMTTILSGILLPLTLLWAFTTVSVAAVNKGLVLIVATLVERLRRKAAARSLPPDETRVEVTSL